MSDMSIALHWFNVTLELLPRLFVVAIAAFISIRFKCLRRVIKRAEREWRYRLVMTVVFGCFAIIGTHSSIPIDLHGHWSPTDHVPKPLKQSHALIGFRDTMTLVAGLVGGPWVGFGAGLIAGFERYLLGGFAGAASGFATVVLGLFAGSVRAIRPQWINNAWGVSCIAFLGAALQRGIILLLVKPYDDAVQLGWEIGIPVAIIDMSGCVLFLWIMHDLDRDRLENEAREARLFALQAQVERDRLQQLNQQSELRALKAQVDPHFLNNTLNDLKSLIRKDPEKARHYVGELADFFNNTRDFAARSTISLHEEMAQLQHYLTLQCLGMGDKLEFSIDIPDHLVHMLVLPGCLITLVENTLKHAFKGQTPPYHLAIYVTETEDNFDLCVQDNGAGIAAERLLELGKVPVASTSKKGGGVALYQLTQSLALAFGEQAGLAYESNLNHGTVARLTLPKRNTE